MKLRDSLAENKSIRLQAEAETWQDAVKSALTCWWRRMLSSRVTTGRFWMRLNSTVRTLCSHQPAMPHGRPEEGVKKTGFALVTLKKPLEFNHEDNDPVDILITMAAVDANTHRGSGHHADRQPV